MLVNSWYRFLKSVCESIPGETCLERYEIPRMDFEADITLKEWAKDKPLSILQLDPADRAVLRIADERDAIQKKTFTKWVNKHLKKTYTHIVHLTEVSPIAHRHVNDLFTDLQDGHNLISLLEVLSGEQLPREKGRMRFHMLQNVELVLNFLRYKKVCIDINT
ncbi:spectrin beta chain, non-erythrocytic 2-like [Halyomorpha halys]|uniref:spectrin beta chain, non-erythrocytic 2-like n=1 Tax=Halyomorpha halys TaxID=286706 RepID=UPI0034D1582C